jgi:hypothetical protein
MDSVSLRLPRSIHERIKELVQCDGMSISQFLATAAPEKVAALHGAEYLESRARQGSRVRFLETVRRAPDMEEPEPQDWFPNQGVH